MAKRRATAAAVPAAPVLEEAPPPPAAQGWRNRIVGTGEKRAADFLANPLNWRTHPRAQRDAIKGALGQVGWLQAVIENRTTGNLVDGHARVELALAEGDDTPVPVVELEPAWCDVIVRRWQRYLGDGEAAQLDGSGETFAQVAAARGVEA